MGRSGSGVEVRGSSIRIKFVLDGETIKERLTLNGKSLNPTPANVKYANRFADDIRKKIAQGTFSFADFFPDSPRAKLEESEVNTFGKLASLWLESCGNMAAATKYQYATAASFWIRLIGAPKRVPEITHKFLAAKIGGYPWPSAKSHNNYLIALRGIMALEYRGANAVNNPLNGIENMPIVKKLPDPLTANERDAILGDIKAHYDERIYAYFLFMFFTGMRPEEAIALRWADIDWNNGVARIQRVRTFKGSERDGSKTNTERDVDLVGKALDALKLMKPHTFMASEDVFQNPVTGRTWHDERSQRDHYWKPALKRLGIRWRKAYSTRSTYATAALMAGVPPAYIANQLGNSLKMLLERYARWLPSGDNGNAKAMMMAAMETSEKSQIRPKIKIITK